MKELYIVKTGDHEYRVGFDIFATFDEARQLCIDLAEARYTVASKRAKRAEAELRRVSELVEDGL